MLNLIEINNCKHYFLNQSGEKCIYFIHDNFSVEVDFLTKHPFGCVYKPKGCLDTLIRFVRQPNNSTLMFKVNEWNVPTNSFFTENKFFTRHELEPIHRKDGYCI